MTTLAKEVSEFFSPPPSPILSSDDDDDDDDMSSNDINHKASSSSSSVSENHSNSSARPKHSKCQRRFKICLSSSHMNHEEKDFDRNGSHDLQEISAKTSNTSRDVSYGTSGHSGVASWTNSGSSMTSNVDGNVGNQNAENDEEFLNFMDTDLDIQMNTSSSSSSPSSSLTKDIPDIMKSSDKEVNDLNLANTLQVMENSMTNGNNDTGTIRNSIGTGDVHHIHEVASGDRSSSEKNDADLSKNGDISPNCWELNSKNEHCFMCRLEHCSRSSKKHSEKYDQKYQEYEGTTRDLTMLNEDDLNEEIENRSMLSGDFLDIAGGGSTVLSPNELEKKNLKPSLVIKLYNNYFSIEMPTTGVLQQNKKAAVLAYNQATRVFLREIASCKIVPELLSEEFQHLPVQFYEGCILVKVLDLRQEQQNMRKKSVDLKLLEGTSKSSIASHSSATATNSSISSSSLSNKKKKKKDKKANNSPATKVSSSESVLSADLDEQKVDSSFFFLQPDHSLLFTDINEFLDQQMGNQMGWSADERLQVMQKVLHLTKGASEPLCLSPSPMVCKIANIMYYNRQKQNFRRRTSRLIGKHSSAMHSKLLLPTASSSAEITPSGTLISSLNTLKQQQARKQEYSLINFINQNGWKTSRDRLQDLKNAAQSSSSSKQKKPKKRGISSITGTGIDPISFLSSTNAKLLLNNKNPNRARLLEFQATHDKRKVWKVQIYPTSSGKKYEALLSQAGNEQASRWSLGGRHAMELYVSRLKDMFTSNGKTRCVNDREIDYAPPTVSAINSTTVTSQSSSATTTSTGTNVSGTTPGTTTLPPSSRTLITQHMNQPTGQSYFHATGGVIPLTPGSLPTTVMAGQQAQGQQTPQSIQRPLQGNGRQMNVRQPRAQNTVGTPTPTSASGTTRIPSSNQNLMRQFAVGNGGGGGGATTTNEKSSSSTPATPGPMGTLTTGQQQSNMRSQTPTGTTSRTMTSTPTPGVQGTLSATAGTVAQARQPQQQQQQQTGMPALSLPLQNSAATQFSTVGPGFGSSNPNQASLFGRATPGAPSAYNQNQAMRFPVSIPMMYGLNMLGNPGNTSSITQTNQPQHQQAQGGINPGMRPSFNFPPTASNQQTNNTQQTNPSPSNQQRK